MLRFNFWPLLYHHLFKKHYPFFIELCLSLCQKSVGRTWWGGPTNLLDNLGNLICCTDMCVHPSARITLY